MTYVVSDTSNPRSTLSELLRRVRAYIGENYSEEWLDPTLIEWINMACYRLAARGDFWWMQSEYQMTATPGTTEYDLPANMKKLIRVYNGTTKETFQYVPPEYWNTEDTPSIQQYSIFGDQLQIEVTASTPLRVRFLRFPPKLVNGTDTTIVPPEYEDAIVYFAAARAREQEEEFDQAVRLDQKFRDAVDAQMIQDMTRVSPAGLSMKPLAGYY